MELHYALLSGSTKLFPAIVVKKAIEKSSQVLHDAAVRDGEKAITAMKHIQFYQSVSCCRQSSKCSNTQSTCRFTLQKTSASSSSKWKKGKRLEGSSLPSQPQVGDVPGQHWHSWVSCGAEDWTMEVFILGTCPLPPPPTFFHRYLLNYLPTVQGLSRLRHF